MPRALVIGNGSVLATFDERLQLKDLYFPHVGMEDHTAYGDVHRTGVWVKGRGFAWFSDPSWVIDVRYKQETLVGNSLLRNDKLGIEIIAEDYVHPVRNILVRHFRVRSTDSQEKEVRIFFHHDLHIYGDKQKDTAFYEPSTNSVIHYRQNRYFLIGGETDAPTQCRSTQALDQYHSILHNREALKSCGLSGWSIGKSEYKGLEGTWRDAEDGALAGTTIDQGSVDSTVGIHAKIGVEKETSIALWVCLGKTLEEVIALQQFTLEESIAQLQWNCNSYWKSWVNKSSYDFNGLSPRVTELFKRSLLTIRLHVDHQGGIVAAADSDIMEFNRDTYTYVWPRDGAFVSLALDRAKYIDVTRRFFEFCGGVQSPDGYFLHKYNPDGSLGSSWHPWFRDDEAQLPIQEDETALILYALWKHFEGNQDFEFLQRMYETLVKKAAQFLCDYRESDTGLPLASYDLWEEHRGIFSYTTACVVAGLHAAAKISHILGHYSHSERYQTVADEVQQALLFHLFDEKEKRFLKMIKRKDGKTTARDSTPDASLAVIWKLGVLPLDDPRIVSTMEHLERTLRVQTPVGGYARYTNDRYHAKTESGVTIPGNPWIITTLWIAQWKLERAKTLKELDEAAKILDWTANHASSAGMLPEQLHPRTGAPLSVAPLTWSHATYVETVLQYLERRKLLSGSP
ncbi:MAG: glycoside hydrolase family 15 protein [Patescibacteria group bacterium]